MSFLSRLLWVLPAMAGLALAGCGRPAVDAGPPKPVIAASIFPVASLIEQLTGDWAEVVTLLPEGAEEHDFELTADQVRQLNRADLLVLVGNGLDPWAEPKPGMGGAKRLTVLRMGDLIKADRKADSKADSSGDSRQAGKPDLRGSAEPPAAAPDPNGDSAARLGPPPTPVPDSAGPNNHLWLDPVLAERFVAAVVEPLCNRYPQHRAEIERAATRLSADLKSLDRQYRSELSGVRRREMVTFHNAFDLIAHRYGLVVVARLTDIDNDPHGGITPDSYLAAIKAIKKYGLMAIYSEPEFPADEIHSIQRETAAEVLTLDPLGGPNIKGYRTYQEMMLSNLQMLLKGQGLDTLGPPEPLPPLHPPDTAKRKPGLDSDFDFPLHLPSTGKQAKPKGRPDLFSDPDLKFPPMVPSSPAAPSR